MKRFFKHDLTKVCIGWAFLFVFWMVLPADAPYVDAAAIGVKHDTRC